MSRSLHIVLSGLSAAFLAFTAGLMMSRDWALSAAAVLAYALVMEMELSGDFDPEGVALGAGLGAASAAVIAAISGLVGLSALTMFVGGVCAGALSAAHTWWKSRSGR